MTRTILLTLAATAIVACNGDDPNDTDDTDTTDTDDTGVDAPLVIIEGTTSEAFTGDPAAEGLCVDAVDPVEALEDGPEALNVLGSTTVDANGNYTIEDVDVRDASLAIFVILRDCDDSGSTVFPSATGIDSAEYAEVVAGDTLGRDLLYINASNAAGVDQSLALTGTDKTLADGSIMGFTLDPGGTPAAGSVVECSTCENNETFYVDGDDADGLLTTGESVNTETQDGVGLALIIPGEVGNYAITHPTLQFEGGLFGSIEGIAAFTAWGSQSGN